MSPRYFDVLPLLQFVYSPHEQHRAGALFLDDEYERTIYEKVYRFRGYWADVTPILYSGDSGGFAPFFIDLDIDSLLYPGNEQWTA